MAASERPGKKTLSTEVRLKQVKSNIDIFTASTIIMFVGIVVNAVILTTDPVRTSKEVSLDFTTLLLIALCAVFAYNAAMLTYYVVKRALILHDRDKASA